MYWLQLELSRFPVGWKDAEHNDQYLVQTGTFIFVSCVTNTFLLQKIHIIEMKQLNCIDLKIGLHFINYIQFIVWDLMVCLNVC